MNGAGGKALAALRLCGAGLVDLFLPAVCNGCNAADVEADGLCADCSLELLHLVAGSYCPRCGGSLGPFVAPRETGCSACPPHGFRFHQVVRLGPYTDPLRGVVKQFKYHRRESMRRRLAMLLAQAVRSKVAMEDVSVIVPVPMHWRRRLTRGHDHAQSLARALGRQLSLPVNDALVRVRHTPTQVGLARTRRMENLRDAFGVDRRSRLRGASLLLVDDVTTSGATADEAARTLLAAGAQRVVLVVVAKAESPRPYVAPTPSAT